MGSPAGIAKLSGEGSSYSLGGKGISVCQATALQYFRLEVLLEHGVTENTEAKCGICGF